MNRVGLNLAGKVKLPKTSLARYPVSSFMAFHLHIENFRCLRKVDLDLGGVCVLIGPNGAGKSTLLSALRFMSDVLLAGPSDAVKNAGGGGLLRNFFSEEGILLRASHGNLMWEVLPNPQATGVQMPMEERFLVEGQVVIEQLSNSSTFTIEGRVVPSRLQGFQGPYGFQANRSLGEDALPTETSRSLFVQITDTEAAMAKRFSPLVFPLIFYSYFSEPELRHIRTSGSPLGNDTESSADGGNVFTVLRNWKAGDRSHEERFNFVREGLRRAFPTLFEDLDFESAGQIVTGRFYMPQYKRPIPFHLAPTGLLAGLLHLTAVASSRNEGTVAIDEFENSLHPHAIRVLIEHIRERAAKLNLTVLLASHSPVVLDQFRDCPSQAIVMDPVNPPTPLDKIEDPDWLAQFSLGELYAHENIGAVKSAS